MPAFHMELPAESIPPEHREWRVRRAIGCPDCDRGTVTITTGDGSFGTLEPAVCETCGGSGFRVADVQEAAEILAAEGLVPFDAFPSPARQFVHTKPDPFAETPRSGEPLPATVFELAALAEAWPQVQTVEALAREVYERLRGPHTGPPAAQWRFVTSIEPWQMYAHMSGADRRIVEAGCAVEFVSDGRV